METSGAFVNCKIDNNVVRTVKHDSITSSTNLAICNLEGRKFFGVSLPISVQVAHWKNFHASLLKAILN